MKIIILLFSGVLLCNFLGFAQTTFMISGTAKDNSKKPLNRVTVSLLKSTDSSLIKTELTNNQGKFEINDVKPQSYFLLFTMAGNQDKYSEVFTLSQNYVLDVIMEPATKKLEEVTVTATRPMIELRADKTIFNVEGSINAQGSNALELLQKSPGVRVDNNENIAMRGKNGVRIYIDGKMSQLQPKDLAAYLKSINSNDVEAIEMISNPSAKYDASGNAGIINIKLKKNKKFGTNGSVTAGLVQGITPKGNASFNLNYRDKRINVFGNVGTNHGQYRNRQVIYRIQSDSIFDQLSRSIYRNESYTVKTGADFFINKKNTLGFLISGSYGNGEWSNASNAVIIYQPTKQYIKTLYATNAVPGERININNNINYRFADTAGLEVNVDADYGIFRGTGRSYQPNYYLDGSGNELYSIINSNNTPTDIDIYTAKIDVEYPKWKGKLGYGAKTSYVQTKNAFEFFTEKDRVPIKNLGLSNRFKYLENVNAAYVNYSTQLTKKTSFQSGLRVEQTNSEGNLTRDDGVIQPDNNIKRHYINLFPSAAISYTANKKNTLALTYSRRIDRPSYQDLNPFEFKLDELTYEKGNAFLKPQYTNNFELAHTFKGILTTTLGYSHVKDYRAQILDTTNGNATFVQQRNLATQKIYSVNIGSSLPIAKWWNGYANFYINQQKFKGEFINQNIDLSIISYGGYMQHTFTLGKSYIAEISGWLNGPGLDGTIRSKAFGGIDLGLQKTFMKKRASLKISVTDIFNTAKWAGITDLNGVYANISNKWESQTVRANFTYRFGSNQISSERQRKTGLETEAGRIKGRG